IWRGRAAAVAQVRLVTRLQVDDLDARTPSRFKKVTDAPHDFLRAGDIDACKVEHAARTREGVLHIDHDDSRACEIDLQGFRARLEAECRHARFAPVAS